MSVTKINGINYLSVKKINGINISYVKNFNGQEIVSGTTATCSTTPTSLTLDSADAGYDSTTNCMCDPATWPGPGPELPSYLTFQDGYCPDGYPYWTNGYNYAYYIGFYDAGGGLAWHLEIRVLNSVWDCFGSQWYGIKAGGDSPVGTYIADPSVNPDCGDPGDMTGTVVVTETV